MDSHALDFQWDRLTALTREHTVTALDERDQGANYSIMLQDLKHDRIAYGCTMLGMYRAPASKDRHHDREGGLVQHLLEMWDLWQYLRVAISNESVMHTHLNDAMVWRAILHHDLNKVWRYKHIAGPLWAADYAEDRMTMLMTAPNKSLWILSKYNIKLDMALTNSLLGAEGGYARTKLPVETVLTKVVYILDELSANVTDRLSHGRFWDSKRGGLGENGS